MDKVTYSTDTTAAVPGAALSAAGRFALAATGNSTAGYFGGGGPGPVTTMDKVTYSTDTTAAVPGANLSVARSYLAATGNSTSGYFGGGAGSGFPVPVYSTMEKVTYASDTTSTVSGAALSAARYVLAASSARANALPTSITGPAPVIV
jgi:hypothetical protein